MGQVMKFWDWPAQGTGSHTYNPDGYAQQSANFGETEYHFELMPLVLDSTSTEDEIYYVAQLLHHLGISVDMQYSGSGSGAYSDDVPPALRNYFRYTCDNHITNYWQYNNTQWANMLKQGGLDEGIPLYYSGSDDNWQGGHAFVCDGYDENNYFHFNWGWSGRDDAWCPIGALNTTKYAFNMLNGFTGHIIPQDDEYFSRPDSVVNMQAIENADFSSVKLQWTNPTLTVDGSDLTSITSVTVRRNFEVIAELTDAQVGADMEYEDNDLEPGLYEYAIYVSNEAGISRTTYRKVLVGDKCNVVFQLHDDGGDGWKGAAISVTSESGQRIAVVTMTQGSDLVVDLPLLRGELNFIWNHGWYHTQEQYDTDYECSFSILDYQGNVLYTSADLEDGVFLTYDNNCEEAPLTCYPVQNLEGEYLWQNTSEFGVSLTWSEPEITANLDHFNIYRSELVTKDAELIAEVPYTGASIYEYYDDLNEAGEYEYEITSVYIRGNEQCESEITAIGDLIVTAVDENNTSISVYPNPTDGIVFVQTVHAPSLRITVSNLLGQTLQETTTQGNATLDLSGFEAGIYFIRIETKSEMMVRKVTVRK